MASLKNLTLFLAFLAFANANGEKKEENTEAVSKLGNLLPLLLANGDAASKLNKLSGSSSSSSSSSSISEKTKINQSILEHLQSSHASSLPELSLSHLIGTNQHLNGGIGKFIFHQGKIFHVPSLEILNSGSSAVSYEKTNSEKTETSEKLHSGLSLEQLIGLNQLSISNNNGYSLEQLIGLSQLNGGSNGYVLSGGKLVALNHSPQILPVPVIPSRLTPNRNYHDILVALESIGLLKNHHAVLNQLGQSNYVDHSHSLSSSSVSENLGIDLETIRQILHQRQLLQSHTKSESQSSHVQSQSQSYLSHLLANAQEQSVGVSEILAKPHYGLII